MIKDLQKVSMVVVLLIILVIHMLRTMIPGFVNHHLFDYRTCIIEHL